MIFPGVSPLGDLGLDESANYVYATVAITAGATLAPLSVLNGTYAQADIVADSAVDALPYLSPVGMHLTVATSAGATLSILELLCELVSTPAIQCDTVLALAGAAGAARRVGLSAGAAVSPLSPNYLRTKPAIIGQAVLDIFSGKTIGRTADIEAGAVFSLVGGRYKHISVDITSGATIRVISGRSPARQLSVVANAVLSIATRRQVSAQAAISAGATTSLLGMMDATSTPHIQVLSVVSPLANLGAPQLQVHIVCSAVVGATSDYEVGTVDDPPTYSVYVKTSPLEVFVRTDVR